MTKFKYIFKVSILIMVFIQSSYGIAKNQDLKKLENAIVLLNEKIVELQNENREARKALKEGLDNEVGKVASLVGTTQESIQILSREFQEERNKTHKLDLAKQAGEKERRRIEAKAFIHHFNYHQGKIYHGPDRSIHEGWGGRETCAIGCSENSQCAAFAVKKISGGSWCYHYKRSSKNWLAGDGNSQLWTRK